MNWVFWAVAAAAMLVVVPAIDQPEFNSASVFSEAADGHSQLLSSIGAERVVIVDGTLRDLRTAGSGTLLLFPTEQPPHPDELRALWTWTQQGGHAILATDGGHANAWLEGTGISIIDAPLVANATQCIGATFQKISLCLASPAVLVVHEGAHPAGWYTQNVTLDLDGQGDIGDSDRPLQIRPFMAEQDHGEGRITVISDANLWQNDAAPENFNLLSALIGDTGQVLVDARGEHDMGLFAMHAQFVRAAARLPTMGAAFVMLAVAVQRMPRAPPWGRHDLQLHDVTNELVTEANQQFDEAQ